MRLHVGAHSVASAALLVLYLSVGPVSFKLTFAHAQLHAQVPCECI